MLRSVCDTKCRAVFGCLLLPLLLPFLLLPWLPGGPYRVDPRSESLVSAGRSFVVGDPLPVEVVGTDEARGRIELRPVGKKRH